MKRFFALLILLLSLSAAVFAEPVYKYESTEPLTDSVSLTTVREFYSDYNISYSYIKMNLEDERIKLKLLKSEEGTDILATVPDLAKQNENTIGAINGDFFSVFSGKKGFSLGIEKTDGEIIQSPINPDTMATVAYDGRTVLMSYLDFHIMAVAPNWEYKEIRHLNKHTSYYGDLLMYTSDFNGGYSPAPGGDVVEVVVEDNVIKEFRRNLEPCKIPENGCVLVVSEGASMFLANNFSVGDEIRFDTYITPSLDDFDTAFGGGSMLVYQGEDVGKIGDYTHTVAGFNPRSAIGVDKEGKTLYLVAVDGRQTSSRGMRMSHLAELLISLGCYNAVNLDGGGSTNLVASTLWNPQIHSVNRPTENRRVINAIGIVIDDGIDKAEMADVAPKASDEAENSDESDTYEETRENETLDKFDEVEASSEDEEETDAAAGIKIKPEKDVAFAGETIAFKIAAHNELLRRVDFDKSELVWSSTAGEIKDGVLYCDKGGRVTVNVTLGELYADSEVYFVDNISGIVTDDVVYLKKGQSKKLPISIFDGKGRYIEVSDPSSFEIVSSDESVISVKDNEIFAKNNGTAIVSVSRSNVKSYVSVAVGSRKFDYINDFEKDNGKLYLYPEDTKGSFEILAEKFLSGSFSGKLSFDFTDGLPDNVDALPLTESQEQVQNEEAETDEENVLLSLSDEASEDVARGVYFTLNEKVLVDESSDKIEVCVFSELPFVHKIKAQLVDGDGKAKNVEFDGEISEGQWSKLVLTVPENIKQPVYLSRIYVLYTPGEEKDSGCIYIDDISFVTNEKYIAKPTPLNSYSINTLNSNVSSSVLFGAVTETDNNNPVTEYERARLKYKVSGVNGIVLSELMKKSVSEDDNAVYVSIDTSNGGIRNTDSSQWEMLKAAVESSKRKNLFVVTNDSIFGTDDFENEVITDYLASIDKNVFVVSRGSSSNYKNIKGVGYFEIDSTPVTNIDTLSRGRNNSLEFCFGDNVTFEFKSI